MSAPDRRTSTPGMRPRPFLASLPSLASSSLSDLDLPSPLTPSSAPRPSLDSEWEAMTAQIGTGVPGTRASARLSSGAMLPAVSRGGVPATPTPTPTRLAQHSASSVSLPLRGTRTRSSYRTHHIPSVPSAVHRATGALRDLVARASLSFGPASAAVSARGSSTAVASPPAPLQACAFSRAEHAAYVAAEAGTLAGQYAALKAAHVALGALEREVDRDGDWYARRRAGFYARKVDLEARVRAFERGGARGGGVRRARSLGNLLSGVDERASLGAQVEALEAEWVRLTAFAVGLDARRRRAAHDAEELRIAVGNFCRRRRAYRREAGLAAGGAAAPVPTAGEEEDDDDVARVVRAVREWDEVLRGSLLERR